MAEDAITPICCLFECSEPAEWRIRHGHTPDDYTESCTDHVGQLLTSTLEHRIYPIETPLLRGVRLEVHTRRVRLENRQGARVRNSGLPSA